MTTSTYAWATQAQWLGMHLTHVLRYEQAVVLSFRPAALLLPGKLASRRAGLAALLAQNWLLGSVQLAKHGTSGALHPQLQVQTNLQMCWT
jgi:hypothetical protein